MASSQTDELLRAAFNIEQTDEAIPTAGSVVDETIDIQLRKWKTFATQIVGEEAGRDSYLEMRAALGPVSDQVEAALGEAGKQLTALAETRREARAEAAK